MDNNWADIIIRIRNLNPDQKEQFLKYLNELAEKEQRKKESA